MKSFIARFASQITAVLSDEVVELCEAFEVSSSGYYAWRDRRPGKRAQANRELGQKIREIHRASRKTYGSPRITPVLRAQGIRCGRKRVARLMRENGLRGAQKARFRPRTTDSRHRLPISPNRLKSLPNLDRLDQVWGSDITYIPTLEGWMYLAAFLDLKSRKIKGWALKDHMRSELVEDAFLGGFSESSRSWPDRPFRSGLPIRLPSLPESPSKPSSSWKHVRKGKLLRQRGHGIVLGYSENGTLDPKTLPLETSGATGDLRLHRDFLQPSSDPFFLEESFPS